MNTLLLHPRYDKDSQILWQAAIHRGWKVIRSQSYLLDRSDLGGSPVAIYGGYMWAEQIADQIGLHLLSPRTDWMVYAPIDLTLRPSAISVVGEVDQFPIFAKSLHDKSIESRIYHSADDFPPGSIGEEILVQPIMDFAFEYRAFVLDGQVVTASCYAKDGQLFVVRVNNPSPMLSWMELAVSKVKYFLPRAVVVDFGLLRDDRRAIVEANPAWCSGIYKCDPDRVLDVVAASCSRTN